MDGLYAVGISYGNELTSIADLPKHTTLELFSINHDIEYPMAEGSVVVPADAKGALVVGAINNVDSQLESFPLPKTDPPAKEDTSSDYPGDVDICDLEVIAAD